MCRFFFKFKFILFVPCIVGNQLKTLNQENAQHNIILRIATCFNPQWLIIRERISNNTVAAVFFLIHFSLPLFPPLLLVILFISTWLQVPIQ